MKLSKNRFFVVNTYLWILNPFTQTFLWAATLGLGAFTSFQSTEIMDFSLPFSKSANLEVNYYTFNFIWIFLVLVIAFALTSWVKISQSRLILDKLLTMPPHDFWLYYGEEYLRADKLVYLNEISLLSGSGELSSGETPDNPYDDLIKAREDVRRILNAMIHLVKKWDSSNIRDTGVIYRANLMKVYYFDDEPVEAPQDLFDLCGKFAIQPIKQYYDGMVCLVSNEYTTSTDTKNPDIDSDRRPIAFPFTIKPSSLNEKIFPNLLGAPTAVADKTSSYVADSIEISKSYHYSSIIDKRVLSNLNEYYSDQSVAHSILSIPIKNIETNKVDWVMNIYRNQDGLLFDGSKVIDFSNIVLPLVSTLNRLLAVIELAEDLDNDQADMFEND